MTSATVPRKSPGAARPNFANTLASEWTKLKSIRATYIETFLTLGLGVGMTALICLAIGSTWDEMNPADRATFNPADVGSFGAIFAVIVLIVFGVMIVSSEYTSGMIRLTLTTTPRKLSVLAAKVVLVVIFTLVLGLIVAVASFYVGQAVLGNYDGVPTASIGDSDSRRAILGTWLAAPVYPLLGAAAAVVLRSTASTITAILALLFVPALFGSLLPDVLQENVLRFLPNYAIDSLTTADPGDSLTRLDTLPAIAVLAAWLIGSFAIAGFSLMRRDV